jgi:hypothetical protein
MDLLLQGKQADLNDFDDHLNDISRCNKPCNTCILLATLPSVRVHGRVSWKPSKLQVFDLCKGFEFCCRDWTNKGLL